jgi:hypothetical protein
MKTYEEWRSSYNILDLGIRWRSVVTFTTRPLYLQGKSPRHLLARRLGGPQSQSGCCAVKKNPLLLPRIEPQPCSTSLQRKHNLLRPWCEILDLLYLESELGNTFTNQHCKRNSYRCREIYHIRKTLGDEITQICSGKQPCITHTSSDTGHATVEVWALTKKRRKKRRRKCNMKKEKGTE